MENSNSALTILWRGRFLILICLLVTVAAAYAAAKLSPKVYESSAIIQIDSDLASSSAEAIGVQQASQGLASTYATLVDAPSFLARIRPKVAGGRYSTADLEENVSGSAVKNGTTNTNLIQLNATAGSAAGAAALANEVARAFVSTIRSDTRQHAASQTAQLQSRISALTQQIRALADSATRAEDRASLRSARSALTSQLATVIANGVTRGGSISVVAPASVPSVPIKPRPLVNILVGAVLGLMLGMGLAWGRSTLDRNVESSAEIEDLVALPVLASIPLQRGRPDEVSEVEAYQMLRTNLGFVALDDDVKVITVSSHASGEGKTSVCEGLARAAARTGHRVLVVDGDVRTRELSIRLGCEGRLGLTNVIAARSDAAATRMLTAVDRKAASPQSLRSAVIAVGDGLSLLAAGPTPPNPASLLASDRLRKIVQEMKQQFDLVVIDSPPVSHLADASLLASASDASIVVARAGRTSRNDLRSAVAGLTRSPVPCLGVVLFEPRAPDAAYYPASDPERRARQWRATAS